jgi:hypothetical protein
LTFFNNCCDKLQKNSVEFENVLKPFSGVDFTFCKLQFHTIPSAGKRKEFPEMISQNLSCPQVFLNTGAELCIAHLDVDISITVTVATVQIKTIFHNQNNYPISGLYKAPNSYGQASVSSCEISFPGTRLVTSVINPDVVKNVNANPNPEAEAFDPLAFAMGFSNCPPNCEVVVTVNYLQVCMYFIKLRQKNLTFKKVCGD